MILRKVQGLLRLEMPPAGSSAFLFTGPVDTPAVGMALSAPGAALWTLALTALHSLAALRTTRTGDLLDQCRAVGLAGRDHQMRNALFFGKRRRANKC
jgi:hypothetical protein